MTLRNPRVWCYAAGGWLIVMGLVQLGLHLWGVVLENAMVGQRSFAMEAMKQAFFLEPLRPSFWRRYRMLSVSLALFFVFAGSVPVLLAWIRAESRTIAAVSLLGTVFWTLTFIPYAFFDPVALPLATAGVAVPLHGSAWLAATAHILSTEHEES
ncbi:MAG: hypothetical protein U5R14_02985 [Gemmatimonadota bacterium]|nr:hypothetical protein [Gemmatimonadota bacterium]